MKFNFPIFEWLMMAGPITLLVAIRVQPGCRRSQTDRQCRYDSGVCANRNRAMVSLLHRNSGSQRRRRSPDPGIPFPGRPATCCRNGRRDGRKFIYPAHTRFGRADGPGTLSRLAMATRHESSPLMTRSSIIGSTFAWILAVLLAVVFIYAGGAKLASNPGMVREFAQIGLGQWLSATAPVFWRSAALLKFSFRHSASGQRC